MSKDDGRAARNFGTLQNSMNESAGQPISDSFYGRLKFFIDMKRARNESTLRIKAEGVTGCRSGYKELSSLFCSQKCPRSNRTDPRVAR